MSIFSTEISTFLKKVGREEKEFWTPVPRNISCGEVGDFLIFRYQLGTGAGSRAQRLVMIVRPVVKCPKTGNILLSAKKIDMPSITSSEDLENLYKKGIFSFIINLFGIKQGIIGKLPKETDYRTYRMNKMYGPLYRLRRKAEE